MSASATTEHNKRNQIGHPAACMMENKALFGPASWGTPRGAIIAEAADRPDAARRACIAALSTADATLHVTPVEKTVGNAVRISIARPPGQPSVIAAEKLGA